MMETPKVPKQHFERLSIEALHLKTELENSQERFQHLREVDEWREWVTTEIKRLQKENGQLKREIKELRGSRGSL